jgi:metal-responsive CopG/Arc/MetJ family transcriptional regulator
MLKAYRPPKGRKRLQLGATIPRDLIDRLAAQSVREQRTRSQIVEEAIRHYLAEKERKAA